MKNPGFVPGFFLFVCEAMAGLAGPMHAGVTQGARCVDKPAFAAPLAGRETPAQKNPGARPGFSCVFPMDQKRKVTLPYQ